MSARRLLGIVFASVLLAGCGAATSVSVHVAAPQLTGHVQSNTNDYVVPLAYCASPRLDEDQLNLTTCAAEQAHLTASRLSRALAAESEYLGASQVAGVQSRWEAFVSALCARKVHDYLGGSEYGMQVSDCIGSLEAVRLQGVAAELSILRAHQQPSHRAGRFSIRIAVTGSSSRRGGAS